MPRGSKDKYTDKQKRQAEHIAESYAKRGVGKKTAKSRAWATVNKTSQGGEKPGGGGYGKPKISTKGTTKRKAARKKRSG
ncbi:MAG: hypothetical protein SFX18_07050 [Pirellulales bacterium]|nr:hypothetical protein [Pirellulales bacterium]